MAELILEMRTGTTHTGWLSAEVFRSMESVTGAFMLRVTDRWAGPVSERPIRPGAACTLVADGEIVITGYVDTVAPSYDADSHSLTIAGRDRTGDLVDCSAEYTIGQWTNTTLLRIATILCAPFDIPVSSTEATPARLHVHGIEPSETVFECLERGARVAGVLLLSDGRGGLVLGGEGKIRSGATLGRDTPVMAASGNFTWQGRYKTYTALGQSPGNDFVNGSAAAHIKGEATDVGVDRHRPLVFLAEGGAGPAALKQQAIQENNTRYGRTGQVTYTVPGWSTRKAGLWSPNTRVVVDDDRMGLKNQTMLIASVKLLLDEQGCRTELGLVRPGAFLCTPLSPEAAIVGI